MTIRASLIYALLFATGIAVHATSIAARRNGYDDDPDNFIAVHGDGGRGDAGDYFNDFGTNSASQPQQLTEADLKKFRTINWEKAVNIRYAHAALASLAFVFFFPIGGIIIRVIPGRVGVYLHALMQFFAYCVFIAAAGMGIWLATYVRFTYYDLFKNYHPIIGLVVFCLLFFQPFTGIIHHLGFKRHGRRTFVSYGHIILGRILITLGMINGGLGLYLANNASRGRKIAYGVVAGVMWLIWMVISIISQVHRHRKLRAAPVAAAATDKGEGVVTNGNGTVAPASSTATPTRLAPQTAAAESTTTERAVPEANAGKVGPEYA